MGWKGRTIGPNVVLKLLGVMILLYNQMKTLISIERKMHTGRYTKVHPHGPLQEGRSQTWGPRGLRGYLSVSHALQDFKKGEHMSFGFLDAIPTCVNGGGRTPINDSQTPAGYPTT